MSKHYHRDEGFKMFEQFEPLFEKLKVRLVARQELSRIEKDREVAAMNEAKRKEQTAKHS